MAFLGAVTSGEARWRQSPKWLVAPDWDESQQESELGRLGYSPSDPVCARCLVLTCPQRELWSFGQVWSLEGFLNVELLLHLLMLYDNALDTSVTIKSSVLWSFCVNDTVQHSFIQIFTVFQWKTDKQCYLEQGILEDSCHHEKKIPDVIKNGTLFWWNVGGKISLTVEWWSPQLLYVQIGIIDKTHLKALWSPVPN